MDENSWEARAATKRAATLDKIPSEWRLSSEDLERARSRRDITGSFIEQFFDKEIVSITSLKTVGIFNAVSKQELTTTEVVRAFCRRAAVAHQIVSTSRALCKSLQEYKIDTKLRIIVFTKSSLIKHLNAPGFWTNTSPNMERCSDHFMVCLSVLKTNST